LRNSRPFPARGGKLGKEDRKVRRRRGLITYSPTVGHWVNRGGGELDRKKKAVTIKVKKEEKLLH